MLCLNLSHAHPVPYPFRSRSPVSDYSPTYPEQFANAFSSIWWSVSTLLTVGYGDICPITTLGKLKAIVISFLGVGMVAIPTGIISAGFVKQENEWVGKQVKDLDISRQELIVMIRRKNRTIIPNGQTYIKEGDAVILYSKPKDND